MSLRTVLGGVGAAIGFVYGGGPQGAQWGWMAGSLIGGLADPQVIKGPSIGDIASQTSQEGGARPIVFGTSQPISGNVIASGPPNVVTTRKRAGKGGPKVETENVYRTYAVGVCEGPVAAFVRVWRNNKLVYDASEAPQVSEADNALFLETARFFLGTFTQNSSPDLEAVFGVGTTPAHRGTAYLVQADEDLTDTGGAIPQWQVQVANVPVTAAGEVRGVAASAGYSVSFSVATGSGSGNVSPSSVPLSTESGAIFIVTQVRGMRSDSSDDEAVTVTGVTYAGVPLVEIGSFYANASAHVATTSVRQPRVQLWAVPLGGTTLSAAPHALSVTVDAAVAGTTAWCGVRLVKNIRQSDVLSPYSSANGLLLDSANNPLDVSSGAINYESGGYMLSVVAGNSASSSGSSTYATISGPKTLQATLSGMKTAGAYCWTQEMVYPFTGWNVSGTGETYTGRNSQTSAAGFGVGIMMRSFRGDPGGALLCMKLRDIVTTCCTRAGLLTSEIDVTTLPDVCVDGFVITNQYPVAQVLQSLGQIFMFDPSDRDGKIHFVPRGGASVLTITDDMLVEEQSAADEEVRPDPMAVPWALNLNYYDADSGGLSSNKQTSVRTGDRRARGETSLQTAVVMDADKAAQVAEINHKVMVEELGGTAAFSLSDQFIKLTPADVVTRQWDDGRSARLRLTQVDTNDGYQLYRCVRDRQSSYASTVTGMAPPAPTAPPSQVVGDTLMQPLDIHILRDADDNVGLAYYVAVSGMTEAWSGALVELSLDGGQNYIDSQSASASVVMGELLTALPNHTAYHPDLDSSVVVRIDTPGAVLEEATLAQLLGRVNLAAIGNPVDGWELVNFGTAEESTVAGEWTLGTFLRGRKGSTARSHAAGERFVLLERAVLGFVTSSIAAIGQTLTFRATSYGQATVDGTVVSMVYAGMTQIERAVGYLEAHRDGSNAVVSWQGVGRLGGGVAVAHGIRFTGYRVTFDDGVLAPIVVATTVESVTQNISTLGSSVVVRVEQVNSLTDAGPGVEVVI